MSKLRASARTKRKSYGMFEESNSPMELSGVMVDDRGEYVVNRGTKVASASHFQVPFSYKVMDKLSKYSIPSLDYEVAGLKGEDPAAGNMHTVKGYVLFDNPSVKRSTARVGNQR